MNPEDFIPGWLERIEAAQQQPTTEIAGGVFQRIRFGDDYPGGNRLCRDCGVMRGQFHVVGCCVERCPRCEGQAISCDCDLEVPAILVEPGLH